MLFSTTLALVAMSAEAWIALVALIVTIIASIWGASIKLDRTLQKLNLNAEQTQHEVRCVKDSINTVIRRVDLHERVLLRVVGKLSMPDTDQQSSNHRKQT